MADAADNATPITFDCSACCGVPGPCCSAKDGSVLAVAPPYLDATLTHYNASLSTTLNIKAELIVTYFETTPRQRWVVYRLVGNSTSNPGWHNYTDFSGTVRSVFFSWRCREEVAADGTFVSCLGTEGFVAVNGGPDGTGFDRVGSSTSSRLIQFTTFSPIFLDETYFGSIFNEWLRVVLTEPP